MDFVRGSGSPEQRCRHEQVIGASSARVGVAGPDTVVANTALKRQPVAVYVSCAQGVMRMLRCSLTCPGNTPVWVNWFGMPLLNRAGMNGVVLRSLARVTDVALKAELQVVRARDGEIAARV